MAQFLAQRWRRQPQGPVAVDWGNPLTRGLKAAFDLRTVRDLVTQTGPSLDTASTVVNWQGVGKTFPSTTTTQFAHRSNYALTGPMTAFVLADINTLSNYTQFISKEQNATTNVAYEFRCGVGSATGSELVLVEATAGGEFAIWCTFPSVVSAGFSGSVAFTRDSGIVNGGNRNFFANGKKFSGALSYSSGSTSIGDDGASAVIFGSRVDAVTRLDGRVYLASLWDRALSDSEIAALSENPWQLFRAPRPIIYSLPSSTVPVLSAATAIDIGSTSARPRVTITI